MFAASIAPSASPAPSTVCSSSTNSTTLPSEATTSASAVFSRCSNWPRNWLPATIPARSSATRRVSRSVSGTSPSAMRSARPSTMAVLPTPASPISTALFLRRRARISTVCSISSSRPITGSMRPRPRRGSGRGRTRRARGSWMRPAGAPGERASVRRVRRRRRAGPSDAGAGAVVGRRADAGLPKALHEVTGAALAHDGALTAGLGLDDHLERAGRSAQMEQGTVGVKGWSGMFPKLGRRWKPELKRLSLAAMRDCLLCCWTPTAQRAPICPSGIRAGHTASRWKAGSGGSPRRSRAWSSWSWRASTATATGERGGRLGWRASGRLLAGDRC